MVVCHDHHKNTLLYLVSNVQIPGHSRNASMLGACFDSLIACINKISIYAHVITYIQHMLSDIDLVLCGRLVN